MPTTKISSITLKAFRSFVDETTIKLPDSGLVLIRGKNVDTPGVSSGSGKSSLLLALAHGLGYCPFPATELQSWLTNDSMEVKLELVTTAGRQNLKRGNKTTLTGEGVGVTGAKAVDAALTKLVGLEPELLAALTYRPQQTRGLFLSKTNAEMQDFLSILLGMDKFESAISVSQEKIKALATEVEIALNKKQMDTQAHTDAQNVPMLGEQHYPENVLPDAQKAVRVMGGTVAGQTKLWKAQVDKVNAAIQAARAEGNARLAAMDKPVFQGRLGIDYTEQQKWEAIVDTARRRLERLQAAWDDDRATITKQQSKINENIWNADKQLQKIPTIRKEIDTIRARKCPRCQQEWHNGATDIASLEAELTKMVELETDIIHWKTQLAELDRQKTQQPPSLTQMAEAYDQAKEELAKAKQAIDSQCAIREAQHNTLLAEYAQRQAEITAQIHIEVKAIEERMAPTVNALRISVEKANEELARVIAQENSIKERMRDFEQRNAENRKHDAVVMATIARTAEALEASRAKHRLLDEQLRAEQDLLSLLKEFMGKIFDEVLAEIAWGTNQMLSNIPNVSHVTINFKSETITLKGSTRKSITPVLMINGAERPLRSALSGGMLAAIELAVDLSVRNVIAARSGNTPGWLVLDECFEGLGVVEKEACMGLLSQAAKDTLILVVDHSSEFKELFTKVIEIENHNGRSTVKE